MITLLLAALITLLRCAESGFEYNNPWDDKGTNYNGGGWTITFDPNGGGVTVNPTSVKTGKDKNLASLPEPKREGYTFDGWYTAQTGGTIVTTSTVFNSNTTIYARWTLNTYTITLDYNYSGSTKIITATEMGGKLTYLPTPTRNGYTFDGWWTDATNGDSVTINNVYSWNTTIYARWIERFIDDRDGNVYRMVTIGTQVWMAENLNYDTTGSKCYYNNAGSCAKYGRLYNWSTAKTACPSGWHLPRDVEWTMLTDYIGGLSTAGKKLKSMNSWNSGGYGTDEYGFSALPGGYGSSGGSFSLVGDNGLWWSATEDDALYAWYRDMPYSHDGVSRNNIDKTNLYSVRCLQDCVGEGCNDANSAYTVTFDYNYSGSTNTTAETDADGRLASLPTPARTGYSFNGWYTASTGGTAVNTITIFLADTTIYARWTAIPTPTKTTFIDSRDGKTYNKVTIGDQTWMAENLNYDVPGATPEACTCNKNADSTCEKYGRLYDWYTANNICPSGWHLPSIAEWATLVDYVGGESTAGTKLKSSTGWESSGSVPTGTDEYGFSALPGGWGDQGNYFNYAGNNGMWWSATENGAYYAWYLNMGASSESVSSIGSLNKGVLHSVRCVAD